MSVAVYVRSPWSEPEGSKVTVAPETITLPDTGPLSPSSVNDWVVAVFGADRLGEEGAHVGVAVDVGGEVQELDLPDGRRDVVSRDEDLDGVGGARLQPVVDREIEADRGVGARGREAGLGAGGIALSAGDVGPRRLGPGVAQLLSVGIEALASVEHHGRAELDVLVGPGVRHGRLAGGRERPGVGLLQPVARAIQDPRRERGGVGALAREGARRVNVTVVPETEIDPVTVPLPDTWKVWAVTVVSATASVKTARTVVERLTSSA